MNEFTKTKIHFTLALLAALFALHPFLDKLEDVKFDYLGYPLKFSYAYVVFAGLLALCVYLFALTMVSERPHSWLERLGNYCYGLAIMSLPFYGGLYLASLLAEQLGESRHLAYAAPGVALGLGIGWFVLSQVFAWFLRGRLGAQDRSAKVEQFAKDEVKALEDARELFASDHYDLAVMQAYHAVEARLRRVLLNRGGNLPQGDHDALVAAAKRAGLLREPTLTLLEDLQRRWRIAISNEPLTREAAATALGATRDILAAIPVPEPAAKAA
ncbi:MAG TPA: HEPN domain-containing protein [Gemmataceae bacterium]|nr:HEPN domain-containing protein [Gemmataceae bacterium]